MFVYAHILTILSFHSPQDILLEVYGVLNRSFRGCWKPSWERSYGHDHGCPAAFSGWCASSYRGHAWSTWAPSYACARRDSGMLVPDGQRSVFHTAEGARHAWRGELRALRRSPQRQPEGKPDRLARASVRLPQNGGKRQGAGEVGG